MKTRLLIPMLLFMLAGCKEAPAATPIPMLDFKPDMLNGKLYKGKIVTGKRWKDARGENIVVLCESGVYWKDIYDATRGSKLYAYHFLKNRDSVWEEAWKMTDRFDDCAWDVNCEFFEKSLSVTDLDGDGLGEVSFAYVISCKGDGQPDEKKLIFFEGIDRYSLKGQTYAFEKHKRSGDKVVEKKFEDAPNAFVNYANQQFSKFGSTKSSK